MKTRSTFHVLTVFIVLLTINSGSVFGSGQRPIKPEVDRKQNAVLLIGYHKGIHESNAQRAALLVAQELRKQGIHVGDPVRETSASGTVYRVVLRRSNENEKILFRLSEENTDGTIFVEREMLFADIQEGISAIPRLVYALVHRKPFRSIRVPIKAGGFTAIVPVGKVVAPGVGIGLSIDMLSYVVDMEGRFALGDTGYQNNIEEYFHFLSFSFGGRYFFMKRAISPYIGGGIGMMFTKYTTTIRTPGGFLSILFAGGWEYDINTEKADGIGVYGVLGVELLRFSQGQLKFELRVDRPSFKLPSQDVMQITLGIAGGWSF